MMSFAPAKSVLLALLTATATLGLTAIPARAQGSSTEQPDKYTWLEDIHGEKPMAWVKEHNERTAAVLEKNPHFAPLQAEALKVLESPERLPVPQLLGGMVYNTWRDAQHLRGIVRRASLEDYLNADPKWETVLDIDELAKADKQSWVFHGLNCLHPEDQDCLVALSAGGEDANTVREFDLKTAKFVDGGIALPRGKQQASWLDKDTLLISRDYGPDTMSESGYPITVRVYKRGESLDQAKEIFRGNKNDNGGTDLNVFRDGQGNKIGVILIGPDIQTTRAYVVLQSGVKQLAIPDKAQIHGLLDGQLIVELDANWTPEGSSKRFAEGTIVSLALKDLEQDTVHLKPTVIFAPTTQEFAQEMRPTKDHLVLTTLNHVQGRAYVYTHNADGHWTRKQLPVPDNQSVDIVTTSPADEHFFLSIQGFITPPSLWLGDAAGEQFSKVKEQKPLFDATNLTVDQLEATSKDGTKVPYFVVHRKDMKYDGNNPTWMTAYGGFLISETPRYSAPTGKLWLEKGGVYVLANIRGGGEFGPAWHDAGLKTHRQRIYDDFYAVARDLIARKITSTRRLGISGGSNGGLLMGVEFTQHPDMWRAVVIQVPLLDMLGFEHMSAGASWIGEYGSVKVPEERKFLASISPYNQLKPSVKYPEPLIFTTTKDDRVGPVHARKFAAKMEEFHEPFFYDEITEGGHGAGADNRQEARTRAEMFTYLMMKLMD